MAIDENSYLIFPAQIARVHGVSNEAVQRTAKKLGIKFQRTAVHRELMTLRHAQQIDKDFTARSKR